MRLPKIYLPSSCKRTVFAFIAILGLSLQAHENPPSFNLAFYPGSGSAEGNGVAVDPSGNIYVTGQYTGTGNIGGASLEGYGAQDYFLASFDATGAPRWGVGAGTSSSDYGTSVKIAPNGDVVISASIFTPTVIHGTNFVGNGGRDAIVARYTSSGSLLWLQPVGGSDNDEGDEVTVDSDGNVILAGRINGVVTFGSDTIGTAGKQRQFLAKFDATGNPLWAKTISMETIGTGTGVTVDSNDNIYVTGQDIIGGQGYVMVGKYNSGGTQLWSTNHPSSSSSTLGTGVGVDAAGNVYVCGTFASSTMTFGTTTLDNANFQLRGFVVKHDPNGGALWASRVGGRAYRLSVTGDGTVYTTGFYLAASGDFDDTNLVGLGSNDAFITKHGTDGQLTWIKQVATSNREILRSITADDSGVVHVTGEGTTGALEHETFPQSGSVVVGRLGTEFIPKFTLTRSVSPSGSGSVAPSPSTSDDRYFSNTVVQITAHAAFGKGFAGWSGDVSGTDNPTTILMDGDKTVTALFTNAPIPQVTLTTNVSPEGSGVITLSPDNPDGQYNQNSIVSLTAEPAEGMVFVGWTGSMTTSVNPVNLFMTEDRTMTALFTNATATTQFTLATNVSPSGAGSIIASPGSPNGLYDSNTVVTLTAVPVSGKAFAGWTGAINSSSNPVEVTIQTNGTVIATFTNIPSPAASFLLTATASPEIGGTVTVDPESLDGTYASNTLVTLTATAASGYQFSHWSGLAKPATSQGISVRMRGDRTLTAVFTNLPQHTLSLAVSPIDAGSIVASPASDSGQYPVGTIVTLTAESAGTNRFAAWFGGGISGITNQIKITMNGDKAVTALFDNPGDFVLQKTTLQTAVWFMDTTEQVTAAFLNNGAPMGSNWRVIGAADFDGNGSKDILLRGLNNQAALWLMDGNHRMGNVSIRDGLALSPLWRLAATGDFNDDNSPDLLWQNNTSGFLHIWFMDGTTYASNATVSVKVGSSWRVVDAPDFDGDGSADILFQHTTGKVAVWFMDGVDRTSAIALRNGFVPKGGWRLVGAKDMDEDGHQDIVFQQNDTGRLLVWFFEGTTYLRAELISKALGSGWSVRALK